MPLPSLEGRPRFGFDTSLSNLGRVAFAAELDDFDEGLFVGGAPLRTVYLASSSPFIGSSSRPSLNDLGLVAFSAELDSGESGVFLGTRAVILTSQRLDGSVVTNALVCSEGLSNLGRIAFVAQLEDGRTGIYVARPALGG